MNEELIVSALDAAANFLTTIPRKTEQHRFQYLFSLRIRDIVGVLRFASFIHLLIKSFKARFIPLIWDKHAALNEQCHNAY